MCAFIYLSFSEWCEVLFVRKGDEIEVCICCWFLCYFKSFFIFSFYVMMTFFWFALNMKKLPLFSRIGAFFQYTEGKKHASFFSFFKKKNQKQQKTRFSLFCCFWSFASDLSRLAYTQIDIKFICNPIALLIVWHIIEKKKIFLFIKTIKNLVLSERNEQTMVTISISHWEGTTLTRDN